MSFSSIYGQEGPIAVLRGAIGKNRVPHAFLFYGAEGIGKRTTALVFAKALNCEKGGADSCDGCTSCRKIDSGNHPDILIIEPEGQFIKVADIKGLQERMRFRPLEGARRVVIIDDAERMNITSANSLLKTLEEPSPTNVFVLVSSRPHLLPLTIPSRCHRLRFNPVQRDVIAAFLEKEIALFPDWIIWHTLISPRLALRAAESQAVGKGAYRVRLVLENTGWLPTYVTKKAVEKKVSRGVICEIELPPGASLRTGKPRQEFAELEGRAYKSVLPEGYEGDTDDRLKVEWVIHAPQGGTVKLTARHGRAGVVRVELPLEKKAR